MTDEVVKKKTPVAIYARVSSDEQAKGESVEHQISLCRERVANLGDEFYNDDSLVYKDEGISGYSTTLLDRPDVQQMISDARMGKFGVVIFKDISRLARDNEEILKAVRLFTSHNVRVILINNFYDSINPQSEIMLPLSGLFAEQFSQNLSLSVSSALRQKSLKGKWASKAPLGYKVNKETKKLEFDEKYADMVRLIFDLYVNKMYGCTKISEELKNRGYRSKRGHILDHSHIRRIIKNEAYIGVLEYGKTKISIKREYDENNNLVAKKQDRKKRNDFIRIEDAHPKLIDPDLFWKAKSLMNEKTADYSKRTKAKYPLVGLLYCHCGSKYVYKAATGKDIHDYYRCGMKVRYGWNACKSKSLRAGVIERVVLDSIQKKLQKIDTSNIQAVGEIETITITDKINQLESEKKKLIKNQTKMAMERDLYPDEVFVETMKTFKSKIMTIEEQVKTLNERLKNLFQQEKSVLHLTHVIEKYNQIQDASMIERRVFFHDIIEKIEMADDHTVGLIKYKYVF